MKAPEIPKHITDAFDSVIEYMDEQAHESPDAHSRVTQLRVAIEHLGLFMKQEMKAKWDEAIEMCMREFVEGVCTKPDCDCIIIAEQNAGGPVKNYECLAGDPVDIGRRKSL